MIKYKYLRTVKQTTEVISGAMIFVFRLVTGEAGWVPSPRSGWFCWRCGAEGPTQSARKPRPRPVQPPGCHHGVHPQDIRRHRQVNIPRQQLKRESRVRVLFNTPQDMWLFCWFPLHTFFMWCLDTVKCENSRERHICTGSLTLTITITWRSNVTITRLNMDVSIQQTLRTGSGTGTVNICVAIRSFCSVVY